MNKTISEAVWVCNTLFARGKVSGSTANLSFKIGDKLYITPTNFCFGRINEKSFSIIKNGKVVTENMPSKEIRLHEVLYENNPKIKAVIHTHSIFSTYWSCIHKEDKEILIDVNTPYLSMKVGRIGWVRYEKPGSEELYSAFVEAVDSMTTAYLMQNHGVIVSGDSVLDAFYKLEELEESAKLAWMLKLNK